MRLGIVRLYTGASGTIGYYNSQELGIAKELVKNLGIEVYIFILKNKKIQPTIQEIDIDNRIKIVNLPVMSIGVHGLLNPNVLNQFKLDVIQLNSDNQLKAYNLIKWALKKEIPIYTYIGTVKSDSNNRVKEYLSHLILIRNKIMMKKVINIVKTPSMFDKLKETGIENVSIIPVGLDIENFKGINNMDNTDLYNKYNLPQNKKILLFVGRLEEYKKPLFTLELIKYINAIDNKYHLLVVGNGNLKDKFIEYIERLNIKENVTFIEKIENKYMAELYSVSDIFINTNDKEIYGMSILESMYCGCPVVAKRAPGPEFIIENGQTGYLIDDYDKNTWYKKINNIILNKKLFSDNCKCRIENEFLWSVISDKYKDLIRKIRGEQV